MKRMMIAVSLISMVATFFVAGCGNGAENEVRSVAQAFLDATVNQDYAALISLTTGKQAKEVERKKIEAAMMPAQQLKAMKAHFAKMKMQVGEVKLDGEKAICKITVNGKENRGELVMSKVADKWLVSDD